MVFPGTPTQSLFWISTQTVRISIVFFPLTTMPESYIMTIPFLILIHVLAGMSTAGMLLCTGNIALKFAPRGKATTYLATNALISGVSATIAPILGGIAADELANKELRLTLTWISETMQQGLDFPAMNLRGLDFLFITAVVVGMYSLHRLILVKEGGEVEEGVVLSEFHHIVGRAVRHISNMAGIRYLFHFPYSRLMELFVEDDVIQDDESGLSGSPGLFHAPSIKKKLDVNIDRTRDQ